MRLAYITMQWPAASETFAIRDIRSLQKLGHEVTVYAMRPALPKAKIAAPDYIPALIMGFVNQVSGIGLCFLNLRLLWRLTLIMIRAKESVTSIAKSMALYPAVCFLVSRIEKDKPDIVHLFWGHFPSMVVWMMGQKGHKMPFTMFLGPYDLDYHYHLSTVMAHDAGCVFTHTNATAKRIAELGIELNKIQSIVRGIEIKPSPSVAKRPYSCIDVGRLLRSKGVYEMVDVFAAIRDRMPQATLTIIGDGEEKSGIKQAASKKKLGSAITFMGWVSSEEVLQEIASHQVLLFLSHSEKLPNAVKEAMMMRVVPVSSDTDDIAMLIADGENGLIVDHRDKAETIAARVAELLSDQGRLDEMADRARQKILDEFDVDVSMKRYATVWQGILES